MIKYCGRPFKDTMEMNDAMVRNWNSVVGTDDIVIHLGDFIFGNRSMAGPILDRLNGQKILTWGNHDRKRIINLPQWGKVLEVLDFEYCGYKFLCRHIPWQPNEMDSTTIYLHGHTHGNQGIFNRHHENKCKIDCSVENWNYTPVSIETIIEYWEEQRK